MKNEQFVQSPYKTIQKQFRLSDSSTAYQPTTDKSRQSIKNEYVIFNNKKVLDSITQREKQIKQLDLKSKSPIQEIFMQQHLQQISNEEIRNDIFQKGYEIHNESVQMEKINKIKKEQEIISMKNDKIYWVRKVLVTILVSSILFQVYSINKCS